MEGDQNNQNPSPTPAHSSVGAVISVIIILVIVLLAGLFFWRERGNNPTQPQNSATNQSSSDDASVIEADLNNTPVENLDAELNAS